MHIITTASESVENVESKIQNKQGMIRAMLKFMCNKTNYSIFISSVSIGIPPDQQCFAEEPLEDVGKWSDYLLPYVVNVLVRVVII